MCISVTLPAITMDVTGHSIRYEIRYVMVKSLRIKRNDGRLSSIFYSGSFLNNTCCSLYLILQTHFRKWHVWELQFKRVDGSTLLASFSSTLHSFVLLPSRFIEYDYIINYDIFIWIGHKQNNTLFLLTTENFHIEHNIKKLIFKVVSFLIGYNCQAH